jgi:DNA-binding LacI/PurR family transcriptional regulator
MTPDDGRSPAVVATMADVARVAGVSKKTVSNYFNGYPYMRDETRRRIESAIADLGYRMNLSARNLSSGRTGTIGLAIPELAHPYFAELAQSVVSTAQRRGLTVLVEVTDGDRDHELAVLTGAGGRQVDGLVLGPIALDVEDIRSASTDVPVVLIGDRVHGGTLDFVTVANEPGAADATAHLLGTGRRRVVALGMERSEVPTAAAQRFHGYLRAHQEAGVPVDEALLVGPLPWNRTAGAEAVRRLLDAGVAFDGVVGFNDALALGALAELLRHGVAVPDAVAVVGFDDVEEARLSYPALSTVDPGRDWIARTAVELLADRLDGTDPGHEPVVLVAEHHLVLRDTA